MAVTTDVDQHAAAGEGAAPVAESGLAALLSTTNHLTVGRLYVATAFVLLLIGQACGVLVGVERIDTSDTLFDGSIEAIFSIHLTSGLYLFLVPAFLGLAIAIVPLQLGASTVAFPRAAAASFWAWLLSSGVLLASALLDGGFPAFATDIDGILLWTIGLGGVAVSLTVAAVCVVTTVLALRTAGMTVDRVPMFSWASFVAGSIWLLSLPVLVGALVLNYLEWQYDVQLGASSFLMWAFGAPQVFAFALPLLGVALDVVPVAAGTRLRNRGVLLGAVGVAAVLSFGADLVAAGADPSIYQDVLYVGASFVLLLPVLAILGGIADTLRRGTIRLSAPLLLGLSAVLLLLAGVAVNALRVIDNLDLVGTSADDAVRDLAIAAGLLGVVGAAWFWSTKLFGVELSEGLGRTAALVILLGGVVSGGAALAAGFLDQPAWLPVEGPVEDGVEALNAVWAAGAALVLLGVLLVAAGLLRRRSGDAEVPGDPWDGQTLEWATASPPEPGGPGPIDPVTSATPLLDRKEA
jgi:heme/copper-type cytochrome/quinol oxidase subunit 1